MGTDRAFPLARWGAWSPHSQLPALMICEVLHTKQLKVLEKNDCEGVSRECCQVLGFGGLGWTQRLGCLVLIVSLGRVHSVAK